MKYFIISIVTVFQIYSSIASDSTTLIVNGVKCGLNGDAKPTSKEFKQNVFKNRSDIPKNVDFDRSITLEQIVKAKENQAGFSQNKAVEIEGYIYNVKPGGVETCNCHATDALFKDTHIEMISDPSKDGPEYRVIVEVTPRLRQMMEDQGIDWTSTALKESIKNKFIRIQGWLFYDVSHNTENFADDPDDNIGRKNWRASSWEVHPITSIEILEPGNPMESFVTTTDDVPNNDLTGTKKTTKTETINTENIMGTNTPQNVLILIVLGAILGMVGQGVRVIVGIKKMNTAASDMSVSADSLFKTRQIVMSLFIAFAIGAVAGVLAAVSDLTIKVIDKSIIIAFITAGYAGTDFIEGFMKKEGNIPTPKDKNN